MANSLIVANQEESERITTNEMSVTTHNLKEINILDQNEDILDAYEADPANYGAVGGVLGQSDVDWQRLNNDHIIK